MKVLVLGYGSVGSVIVKLLAKEKIVESIFVGSKSRHDIEKKHVIKHRKVFFREIDISDKVELLRFFKKVKPDLVINSSLPKFNLEILNCCLKVKSHYLDLASFWDINPNPKKGGPYNVEQLHYDYKFKKNKLIGLINAGVSPGLTNLLARECADLLEQVDYIKIRLIEDTKNDQLFFPWSKEWLLDEINWKPLIYRHGRFEIKKIFSEGEEYDFPKPFGKRMSYLVSQEEVGTIPLFIKAKNLDIKSHDGFIEIGKTLVNLGLTSYKKVSIGKSKVSPFKFLLKTLSNVPDLHRTKAFKEAVFGMVVEASGKKKNKKRTVRYSVVFPKQEKINMMKLNANFISYPTALMTKLFALSIPRIKNKGVFPPECLSKEIRRSILKELKKNHVKPVLSIVEMD